ncbi:MAG: DUF1499 domain-containing protein [Hyphomicrobiales bacterium]|nr:DUF1499 domain-containing protein [Hyphomicrobiales bacterium]
MRANGLKLTLAILIMAAAALLIWPEKIWSLVAGPADLGPVDFASLEKPASPNAYLACPAATCPTYGPDMEPPTFEMDAASLKALAGAVWSAEPGVTLVEDADMSMRFVQRTAWLKFPDTVSVRFLTLSDKQSTLVIYSRSQIGYSDLGANETRVKHWLDLLVKARP